MAVSNNVLIVALESYRLLRVDLDNPLEVEGKKKKKEGKAILPLKLIKHRD